MASEDGWEAWRRSIVTLAATHMLRWVSGLPEGKVGKEIPGYLQEMYRESETNVYSNMAKSEQEQCFLHVCCSLALSHDRMLCLIWSLAPYIDSKMGLVYQYFRQDNGCFLTTELAEAVYLANYPEQETHCRELFLREDAMLLWEITGSALTCELQVREPVRALLLYGDWCGWRCVPGLRVEEPWQWEEKPLGHNSLGELFERSSAPCVCVYGREGTGKRFAAAWMAYQQNRALIRVEYERYICRNRDLAPILFEVAVTGGLVCVIKKVGDDSEVEPEFEEWLSALTKAVGHILWICDSRRMPHTASLGMICLGVPFPALKLPAQRDYWQAFSNGMDMEEEEKLLEFAGRFDFTPKQIKGALRQAQFAAEEKDGKITLEHLRAGCISQLDHRLEQKAKKVEVRYTFEDLVLPPRQMELLKEVCYRIIYRNQVYSDWGYVEQMAYGKGVSVVFSGPPGTGKTMAAQVIAGKLGLELYKIDLAAVVSKYIGETERNLEEIFEEARKSQGILFFDEADVLFSKRTEIKDSNDKYSNMEAAFLLQKMEEYSGMVILATNYQQNIDEAFKRRISFLVDFPFPGREYRRKIWERAFPKALPLSSDIDLDYLARQFELSGSNIKSAAVAAAFLAAADGEKVSMKHVRQSILRELEKCGRKVAREELGIYRDMI